jgi:DNA-binding HxlR family transcriptional regulator
MEKPFSFEFQCETYYRPPVAHCNCYFAIACGKSSLEGERALNRHVLVEDPDIEAFRRAALTCPIPAAVELIGEKWAFLILRGAFNGLQHFEQFQAGLGIARNILSNRLSRLVEGGILERHPDPDDRRKVIYSLSAKGEALLPVVLAIRQWGEDWGHGKQDITLADIQTGKPIRRITVQADDGRPLGLYDLMWIDQRTGEELRRPDTA